LRRLNYQLLPQQITLLPTNLTTDGSAGEFGDFVTNYKIRPDNTEDLYYVNYNRLFRTTSASTVTPATWTELVQLVQL
jgi:hypothetical protein